MKRLALAVAAGLVMAVAPGAASARSVPEPSRVEPTYQLTIAGSSASTTHTPPVTLMIRPRDFGVSATPASVTVSRGQTATHTARITGKNGSLSRQTTVKITVRR